MYYPIIGIEVHIQLNTTTKLFCSCLNEFTPDDPNKNICPFCTGQPGALPLLNQAAVRKSIRFGTAVNGNIPQKTRWDRKNYFYPDLPAGYQISQYDNPIVEGGVVEFYSENKSNGVFEKHSVNLTRAHLEADAGKLLHVHQKTLVDYNRSGCPLLEIVTEPEITTGEMAMGYVSELQIIARKMGISDADMDKGQMRFDCNISLRNKGELDTKSLPPYKVEVKNINSVRALGRAVEFEIQRQTELLNLGETPLQETRGWRDDLNRSEGQRSKEDAMDYRYFPEPDLQILEIHESDRLRLADLPELPSTQRERYLSMGLSIQIANTFVSQDDVGALFDSFQPSNNTKTIANIISSQLIALATKNGKQIGDLASIQNIESLAALFDAKELNNQSMQKTLEILILEPEKTTNEVVNDYNLIQVNDHSILERIVELVIHNNPQQIQQYKSGKIQVIGFLIGQCMKESKGSGNPQLFSKLLTARLIQ
jgi:aspartyl-tRNA(Asn)/glutamyl-tRNA(Gln) amidotransferase subunit B